MQRPWFHIHLSTAIVVMLTASVLLWANTREWFRPAEDFYTVGRQTLATWHYGWPFAAVDRIEDDYVFRPDMNFEEWKSLRQTRHKITPTYLAANIAFALIILTALATLCEWRIRRHKPTRTL